MKNDAKTRPDRSQFQFLSDEEQQELRDKLQKQTEEASHKVDETLAALLKPDQLKRLDEIIIQFQLKVTPAAVIRQQLELTDDQLARLKTVEDEAVAKQLEMRFEMMKRFRAEKTSIFLRSERLLKSFKKKFRHRRLPSLLTYRKQQSLNFKARSLTLISSVL